MTEQRRPTPYLAGATLGVVAAISLTRAQRRLGASTGFEELAGVVGQRLWPRNVFWQHIVPPGFSWASWLLVGVFLGALASAVSTRQFEIRRVPERGWQDAFGPSWTTRWALVFLGAAMIEFGAGIAGGCTSGLAISGGIALAPGAFAFMAAMFAGGIPVAWLVAQLSRRRRAASAPHDDTPRGGKAEPETP